MAGAAERLQAALRAIDAANSGDPERIRIDDEEWPKELGHAQLVSEWVERLLPEASDALRLAARAHHVRRWEIPRSSYPEGRKGYLRWRATLQQHHAAVVNDILEQGGYPEAFRERVQAIVRKRGLGRDPEVQVFEDALCLVFLDTQLEEIVAKLAPEKLEEVVRKTLAKMSAAAIDHAQRLSLTPESRTLLAGLVDAVPGAASGPGPQPGRKGST